jgi:hypothetical protein
MRASEAKGVFLQLLDVSDAETESLTIILPPNVSLQTMWNAFKSFITIPLEQATQVFAFECHYSDNHQLSLSFKRNMYTPFEDDSDAVYPLNVDVTALYSLPKPEIYEYIFFTEEVIESVEQAVSNYIRRVESYSMLWNFLSTVKPTEITLFQ